MKTRISLALALCVVVGAGCSHSANPLAPDVTGVPAASSPAAGAAISGVVLGAAAAPSAQLSAVTSGLTVTIAGTGIVAPVDSSGRFTLSGVPEGDAQLQFSGTGVSATVTVSGVGANEKIQITVTISGSIATLETQQRAGHDNRTEVEGKIESVDASARSVRVAGMAVAVGTDTVIRRGSSVLTFADLTVGSRIHARGVLDGTVVRATVIEVQNPTPEGEVELEGVVSGLTGTCPVLTFTVKGTTVKTTTATKFEHSCAAVRNTVKVQVKGVRQTDGSVVASKVEADE